MDNSIFVTEDEECQVNHIFKGKLKMNTRFVLLAALSMLSVSVSMETYAAAKANQPLTVDIKRLSFDTALRIGQAAIE